MATTTRPDLEPPRTCERCGGRLDVQVFPTGYRASCRRCDHVHPARDRIEVTRTDQPPPPDAPRDG